MTSQNSIIPENFKTPELITSFLYASGISSMLSLIITTNEITFPTTINTVIVIILVFVDWNNRIFIPIHFPNINNNNNNNNNNNQTGVRILWNKKFAKLFFEISGMVLLVLFFNKFSRIEYSNEKDFNIYTIFSTYLILTGLWNINILNFMGIRIRSGIKKVLFGIVIEIEPLKGITTSLLNKIELLEKKLQEDIPASGVTCAVNKFNKEKKKIIIRNNIYRLLPQIIGNHIIWFNLFIALILINYNFQILNIKNNISLFNINVALSYIPLFIMFISAIILFGAAIYFVIKETHSLIFEARVPGTIYSST